MQKQQVGSTQSFVLGQGIIQVGRFAVLIGHDGGRRLFAELISDPDKPEARPQAAYGAILASMQPGWSLRLLQIFWPDPIPRLTFREKMRAWPQPASEGLSILAEGLDLAIQQYPLPFIRRTGLEFVLPGNDGLAWWEGLETLCSGYGIKFHYLDSDGILALATWVLNPTLRVAP